MAEQDDFEAEDQERISVEAGTLTVEPPSSLPAKRANRLPANKADMLEMRQELIEQYHGGHSGLLERLAKEGKVDGHAQVVSLVDEIVKETDQLLGNELVFAQNGEFRESSLVSFKRSEVLEKAYRGVQAKVLMESSKGINIDSPEMGDIFRYFMVKMQETFDQIGTSVETKDLFFRKFGEVTENWHKELKAAFEQPRVIP